MFHVSKQPLCVVVASVLILALVLAWPIGAWLQQREAWIPPNVALDAIYLVAGAEDQDRRVEAIVSYLAAQKAQLGGRPYSNQEHADETAHGRISQTSGPEILIGNDTCEGPWHNDANRNLIMSQWAALKLEKVIFPRGIAKSMEVLSGKFGGTDEEMEILAGHLASRPEIRRLGLVTSPFHVRRVIGRLRTHLRREIQVFAVPAKEELWIDRAPWMVMGELVKMLRDALGLSRTPFLSRR